MNVNDLGVYKKQSHDVERPDINTFPFHPTRNFHHPQMAYPLELFIETEGGNEPSR
jgi:hypothetical protein